MLMSAVVNPLAFEKDHFAIPGYKEQAESFFEGIRHNGLILVDSEGLLKTKLVDVIKALPAKAGQRLGILLAELLKRKAGKKRFVSWPSSAPSRALTETRDISTVASRLKSYPGADSLIVHGREPVGSSSAGSMKGWVVPLEEYKSSEFEELRRWYAEDFPPIDQLKESKEVEEAIVRVIRFAKWLRFYDKQIGTGGNTKNFRKGIEFILKLWRENGCFASRPEAEVTIFTCQKWRVRPDEIDTAKESKARQNKEAYETVVHDLCEPLKRKFSWPIKLVVKEDPQEIFHARHLETSYVRVLFERGFDLFKDGVLKRNIVKIDNGSYTHLRECRDLLDTKLG